MSLSKHALTYLKRHYRALYQRAYALGQATSLVLLLVVGSLGSPAADSAVLKDESDFNLWAGPDSPVPDPDTDVFHISPTSGVRGLITVVSNTPYDRTLTTSGNYIRNFTVILASNLPGHGLSLYLNGAQASFELSSGASFALENFIITQGTLTLDESSTLYAQLTLNGGTFDGFLNSVTEHKSARNRAQVVFEPGGGILELSDSSKSLEYINLTVAADATGTALIKPKQAATTLTFANSSFNLGSELTLAQGTFNLQDSVTLTASAPGGSLALGSTNSAATLNVSSAKINAFQTQGSKGKLRLTNESSLKLTGDSVVELGQAGASFDNSAVKIEGTNFTATSALTGSSGLELTGTKFELNFAGASDAINKVALSGAMSVAGGAQLTINKLTFSGSSTPSMAPALMVNASDQSTMLTIGTLDLAGRKLVAQGTSADSPAVVALTPNTKSRSTGNITGNLIALQNAIIGVGATDTELASFYAQHQDQAQAMVYLKQALSLGTNQQLIADNSSSNYNTSQTSAGNNSIYLGPQSALAVDLNAFTGNQAAIYIQKDNASIEGQTNSKIIIVDGSSSTQITDLKLFADNGGSDGTAVKIADTGQDIEVVSATGLYSTTLEAGKSYGTVTLEQLDPDPDTGTNPDTGPGTDPGDSHQPEAPNPVHPGSGGTASALSSYFRQSTHSTHQALVDYYALSASSAVFNPVLNYTTLFDGSGKTANTVAQLSTYGGIAPSTLAVQASTRAALNRRLGLGAQHLSADQQARSAQGAVLWLTPGYNYSDSSGLSNDRLDYGVELELYGLSLGSDLALTPHSRIGVVLSLGEGKVEGNEAATGVSNDFDYYSLGLYGAYELEPLILVADLSYSAVSNELSAATAMGQVNTEVDSSSWSAGLSAQLNLELGALTLSPHLGLSYQHLSFDDYDLSFNNTTCAHYSAENMQLWSLPLGLTLASELSTGSWSIKPSLDLSLIPYWGDTDQDSTVRWSGLTRSYHTTSAIIDELTYEATLGLSAQSGALALGLELSYSGSEHSDGLGLSAHAHYRF